LTLNLSIAGRLFSAEFLQYVGNLEPIFFSIIHTIRERWPDSGWWAGSNLGYPFAYSYQPLLHHVAALWAAAAGWSEGHAYHATIALFYVLGPIALYALMLRFTRDAEVSFAGGLVYSLVSPSALLIPNVRGDGGLQLVRLHSALKWSDGPNVSGLTLLLISILLLDRARERRSPGAWLLAAIALISVPLMNIPATLALGMALIAYVLACELREWPKVAFQVALACGAGFLLFATWLPPSALITIYRNTQAWMDPAARFTVARLPYYLGLGAFAMTARVLLHWTRASFPIRFAGTFASICVPVVLLYTQTGMRLITEAERFYIAMEIPLVMLMVLGANRVVRAMRIDSTALRVLTGVAGLIIALLLSVRAIDSVQEWLREVSLTNRPEAAIASWLEQHGDGDRVYADGSVAFWLNYLSTMPQVRGCCNQNLLVPIVPQVASMMYKSADANVGETATAWLQTLGVRFVVVNGPKSLEVYHDFKNPAIFDGVLAERWRDGDDVIYEVPLASPSLAHIVRPEELTTRIPERGSDIDGIASYRAAVMDMSRPAPAFRFTGARDAVVSGSLPAGYVYSVQVAYHPGWRASTASGEYVPVGHDALNLMTLAPQCDGPCEIRLHFDGGREVIVLRVLCLLAWLGVGVIFWRGRRIRVETP
jgi:hypothetical protein